MMMRVSGQLGKTISILATFVCLIASPAHGGYLTNGYDLGLVKSETGLANSAASLQTKGLFSTSGSDIPMTTTFTIPACTEVDFSRLYLDIYGGTPYHSAQLTATLNDVALPTLTIGGTGAPSPGTPGDANPATRDPDATCVYGSAFGYWQVAYANIASLLKTDGTANTLKYTITDPTDNFDGRTYGATLFAVYSDPSIHQSLDYQLFEGDGFMRQATSTSPPYPVRNLTRSFNITGVDTSNMATATYTAGYATGHSGQTDQVYFNGNALGSTNDVATVNSNTELHSFDVMPYLLGSNTVNYSIDPSVLGGTGESSLHADVALLTVTHPVPEPGAMVLLAAGGLMLSAWRRKRLARKP